ncbi:MAG TPA: DUF4129 domain-containing protein [Bacilli bacterium]|nr:DUF4129 domain-containing protein [Bacilli bacterium]
MTTAAHNQKGISTALSRVMLVGMLSHAFAFTTVFLILSSLLGKTGTAYLPAFLGTALVLAGIGFCTVRLPKWQGSRVPFFIGIGGMIVGIMGLRVIDDTHTFAPLVVFFPPAFLLWRRILRTLEDMKYVRRALFEQLRADLLWMVIFTVPASMVGADPSWQTKLLPLFTLFLLTRLLALSLASRQLRGEQGQTKTRAEKWQDGIVWFVVSGGLLGVWLLQVLGIPILGTIYNALGSVLDPILMAIGRVVGWVMYLLDLLGYYDLKSKFTGKPPEEGQQEDEKQDPAADVTAVVDETIFYIILVLIFATIIFVLVRKFVLGGKPPAGEGLTESREFILATKKKKRSGGLFGSGPSLSRLRKAYRRFLLAMKKEGHLRPIGETAGEYVEKIARANPERRSGMEALTRTYMDERYGNKQQSGTDLTEAEQLSQQLADQAKSHKKRN